MFSEIIKKLHFELKNMGKIQKQSSHVFAQYIHVWIVIHAAVSRRLIFVPGSAHKEHLGDLSLGQTHNWAVDYA